MTRMTDDELRALIDQEVRQSVGYGTGKLTEQRRKAEAYYLARPIGDLAPPEIEGRSSVVSTDVADTIEWMLPSLLRIFTGADHAVEFAPTTPGDEAAAKQATDYCNYVLQRQNPGFQLIYTWIKDALLQKTGILKVWWEDKTDNTRETYDGMTEADMARLLDDPEIEPIEHSAYPDPTAQKAKDQQLGQMSQQLQQSQQQLHHAAVSGTTPPQQIQAATQALEQMQQQFERDQAQPVPMLHDLVVKRVKKRAQVRIDNVPPEEFLISKRAKRVCDAPFVAHRVQRTISDLKKAGYKNVDDIGSDDAGAAMNTERIERASVDDDSNGMDFDSPTADSTMRSVWVIECYLQCDFDGDGIAEWRKVTRCGGVLLDNEECDGPPFVTITPIPLPHRFNGLSIADLAMPVQKTKTSVLRALMDNLYLQVNGRYFAVENQVNLDDLMVSRPGGVVRMKQAGMAGRLDQGAGDASTSFNMLEYLETQKETRTGWTRYSQGQDGASLNPTATGVNVLTNKADARIELIARVFSETGFKDLALMILKLVSQHQDAPAQMQVAGQWVSVDPRAWRNQFGVTVNVGLGTGNKDQTVQHLMAVLQQQAQGLALGYATPANMYEAALKLAENLQLPQPEKFFTNPAQNQQAQQPKQDPAVMKVQAQAQADQQRLQMEQQLEQQRMQQQAQVDANRQRLEAEQQSQKISQEMQLEQFRAQMEHDREMSRMELDRWKAQLQSDTQVFIERLKIGAAQDASLLQDRMAGMEDMAEIEGAEAAEVPPQ